MLPNTLQYPPTYQLVLGRPSHVTSCPPLPPAPPSPPSFLPSFLLGLHGHPQPSPRADTHTRSEFLFSVPPARLLANFPQLPQSQAASLRHQTQGVQAAPPLPPLKPHTRQESQSPESLRNKNLTPKPAKQSQTQPKRLARTPQTQAGKTKFSIQGVVAACFSNGLSDLGPPQKKCQLTGPRLQRPRRIHTRIARNPAPRNHVWAGN